MPMASQRYSVAVPCILVQSDKRMVQELYEPLWDDLFDRLLANGVYIRSIWIADAAHQGQSGVLNEEKLGNDRKLIRRRGTKEKSSGLMLF